MKKIEKEFKERTNKINKLIRNKSLTRKDLAIMYVDTQYVLRKLVKEINKKID